jgi:hypothetical protein
MGTPTLKPMANANVSSSAMAATAQRVRVQWQGTLSPLLLPSGLGQSSISMMVLGPGARCLLDRLLPCMLTAGAGTSVAAAVAEGPERGRSSLLYVGAGGSVTLCAAAQSAIKHVIAITCLRE